MEQDGSRKPSEMARLTGALIGLAALLGGVAVAVLVGGEDERAVTHSATMGVSLLAVILGAVVLRQTRARGKSGRVLGIASLVVGILGLALWLLVMLGSAQSD